MRQLSLKQKTFVNEYVKTKNGTKAAMKAYNVKDSTVAATIATENIRKPQIKMTIDKLMQASGYNPQNSIANLIAIEQAETKRITGADKIKASETLLKLSGFMVDRKQTSNINYNIDLLDNEQAFHFNSRYSKLIKGRKGDTQKSKT